VKKARLSKKASAKPARHRIPSAGELEAFTHVPSNLSADTGLAFVLVQNLDPKQESLLTDLGRATRMPVTQATQGMPVQANHVYVIPPDGDMTIQKGRLHLSAPETACGLHVLVAGSPPEEQLRQAQKMEAIGRLAGGVAHDFNNMLMAISGYASQLLEALPESGPARRAAEQISKVGDQASVLTRQLLAFSRKQVLRPEHEKLNDVLVDMREMLLRLLPESIEVNLALEPKVGSVIMDAGQIQQVILNLAINARDAMSSGGRLTLTTANVALNPTAAQQFGLPPGDYITLAATDTGAGIEPDILDRLFEPFFTTKAPGAGTGLGLSTVYGIVRRSGGTILVESELGRGATFRIYLPLAENRIEPVFEEIHQAVPGGSETILLVEDAAVVRSVIRELLEQHGYEVLEAQDGAEALALNQNHDGPIHVLLTDLLMPRVNGNQLAKRIRRRRPAIKVIYMSGYSGEALHALEYGANFLEKPFKPDHLAAAIRKALDQPAP
jgi:two-component system cell cycle sensor histidine kinase/response regulator CckA